MNRLCEAVGYDSVIVEAVGVGQSEVAVSNMVEPACRERVAISMTFWMRRRGHCSLKSEKTLNSLKMVQLNSNKTSSW